MLSLNYKNTLPFLREEELAYMNVQLQAAIAQLEEKQGPGEDFLGWLDLPYAYDKPEFVRIMAVAEKIKEDADVLVVVGIGGSYLGARAVIEALGHSFSSLLTKQERKAPLVLFAGQNISPDYLNDLLEVLKDKSVYVNVISKSGTTTEPAIAFRILKAYMEERYGVEEARKRIVATTDKARGALKQLASEEAYETFVVPDDVGGRFSVLSAVGLLPIAVAGFDLVALMQGAQKAYDLYKEKDYRKNICYQYAMLRNLLYRKQYTTELLVNYEPSLHYFAEWWKQLFGESEGKDQKGIFPAAVDFSTDLHSMGQYIQDGKRNLFETVLQLKKNRSSLLVPTDAKNLDQLNFLAGKDMAYVNRMALQGTVLAHVDGGVPNLVLDIEEMNEYVLGHLIYFFEKACGISAYLNAVNPFDQPGVEAYKKNMFALLDKPGFEKESEKLKARL